MERDDIRDYEIDNRPRPFREVPSGILIVRHEDLDTFLDLFVRVLLNAMDSREQRRKDGWN